MKRARQIRKAGNLRGSHMAAFNMIVPERVQRVFVRQVVTGGTPESPQKIERRLLKRKRAKLARKINRNKRWKKRRR